MVRMASIGILSIQFIIGWSCACERNPSDPPERTESTAFTLSTISFASIGSRSSAVGNQISRRELRPARA